MKKILALTFLLGLMSTAALAQTTMDCMPMPGCDIANPGLSRVHDAIHDGSFNGQTQGIHNAIHETPAADAGSASEAAAIFGGLPTGN